MLQNIASQQEGEAQSLHISRCASDFKSVAMYANTPQLSCGNINQAGKFPLFQLPLEKMMKKTTLILCLAGIFAGAAYAESQITLYGILEEGPMVQKLKGSAASVQLKSSFDLGTRWGIRGVEDLGDNWKVGFVLEQGFNIDDGTVANTTYGSNMWTREAQMYIQSDYGKFGMGRFATLASGLGSYDMEPGWVCKGGYGLAGWDQDIANFLRVNNGLVYVSPTWSGFHFSLMYSNGIESDTEQWSHNTHYYGIGLQYNDLGWNSSLIFEVEDNKSASNNITTDPTANYQRRPKYAINFGLEYNFGEWTPMFAFRWVKQDHGLKAYRFGLSAQINLGGGLLKPAVSWLWGRDDTNYTYSNDTVYTPGKVNSLVVALAYEYPLSKRTTIKPFIGYVRSGKGWYDNDFAYTGSQGATIRNGYQIYIGMAHFF
ncbi:MAG: porin [Burkholderiales bacterium]|nr:porin [Burkholderiales bacterium]